MRTLALILFPLLATHGSAQHSPLAGPGWTFGQQSEGTGLAARCLWAERGWQSISVGVAAEAEAETIGYASEELVEHARLHGWVDQTGERQSPLVTEPAQCPPAALAQFCRTDRSQLNDAQARIFEHLARALAENGHVDRALEILNELRSAALVESNDFQASRARDRVTWETALLLESAGSWLPALEILDELKATRRWSDVAIDRVRAHCFFELNRVDELEQLVFDNLTSDPSCDSLELLIRAWRSSSTPKGLPQLLEGCLHSISDPPAVTRIRAEITRRFDDAQRHLHILSMPPSYALDELSNLLSGGDHRFEVLQLLLKIGSPAIGSLREQASNLSPDDLRMFHELHVVLAESGLPQLESLIKTVDEQSGGFPYLELWESARALRRDLRPEDESR